MDSKPVPEAGPPAPLEYPGCPERFGRRLHRVANRIVSNVADAEDVVQDAHLRALKNIGQFGGRAAFSTWLTRITVNQALTELRRRKRHPESGPDPDLQPENWKAFQSQGPSPEQQAYHRELNAALSAALRSLPEEYRTAFALKELNGMSVREAAAVLEVTPACVKTRLFRARQQLREQLSAYNARPAADLPALRAA